MHRGKRSEIGKILVLTMKPIIAQIVFDDKQITVAIITMFPGRRPKYPRIETAISTATNTMAAIRRRLLPLTPGFTRTAFNELLIIAVTLIQLKYVPRREHRAS